MPMPSVMKKDFSRIPDIQCPRSVFNRSCGHKTTFDASYLIPIFLDWVLPGDTIHMSPTVFGRLATPIVPIMDNLYLDTFWFAVPCRLLWDNWAGCMGEQEDPETPTDYLVPIVSTGTGSVSSMTLGDYFGLPVGKTHLQVSALPFRAYNMIYNEWFRDENLCVYAAKNKGDGPDLLSDYTLQKRGKRHDYFTSALLWPQKGLAVGVPIGDSAPVLGTGFAPHLNDGTSSTFLYINNNDVYAASHAAGVNVGDAMTGSVAGNDKAIGWAQTYSNPDYSGLYADLSQAQAATVNSLREAFQLQKMLERDARGGTRLVEIIRQHFGVVSPDARMQRPEFLSMSSKRININPVAQTSNTPTYDSENPQTPQGNLAAYGVVSDQGGSWSKSFTEHCIVMCLANVRADINYQQGINRHWLHRTRFDHYWPSLAHLGEQEILSKEIFFAGGEDAEDDTVFGYQERYAEYRYKPSQITGALRSQYAASLDVWHCAEYFETRPELNQTFITDHTADILDRNIAVMGEPQILFDSHFEYKHIRPMPTYSVPGLIDHF